MHHETTGRGKKALSLCNNSAHHWVEARNTLHHANNTHAHDTNGSERSTEVVGGVGWSERRGSISDRITARQSVSSSTEETHGPVVVITASPHIGEDTERVGVVARARGSRGGDGVHVALVPLEAALPGEGPGADVAEVDIPDRGVQHLVALHVGLVAEGLGTHVAAERARLLPGPPEELRHMRWR